MDNNSSDKQCSSSSASGLEPIHLSDEDISNLNQGESQKSQPERIKMSLSVSVFIFVYKGACIPISKAVKLQVTFIKCIDAGLAQLGFLGCIH